MLALSALLEGYSLLVASRYVLAGAAAQRMSFVQVHACVYLWVRVFLGHRLLVL